MYGNTREKQYDGAEALLFMISWAIHFSVIDQWITAIQKFFFIYIQQGHIKLIQRDSKYIYDDTKCTKDFYSK